MGADFYWTAADETALAWIREIATNDVGLGFAVGPMPDQVYVLHPIFERTDGKPVLVESDDGTEFLDQPDEDDAAMRRVTWAEYARRRDVPMVKPGQIPKWTMPFAAEFDMSQRGLGDVWPPDEGNIEDAETLRALFSILIAHTTGAAAAMCTAFHQAVGPTRVDSDLVRGPLRAWPELYSSDHAYSPQNIWPDTHEWVLNTDPDMWATAVSGTTDLIEDLMRSPDLEAIRLHPEA